MKYYIPEISEFFVGFEFERKDLLNKNRWVKSVFKDGESVEQYCDADELGRVKCLDEVDIEELGFKKKAKLTNNHADEYLKDNILLTNYGSIVVIDIHQEYDSTMFKGRIRNKSELEKLLKMLL